MQLKSRPYGTNAIEACFLPIGSPYGTHAPTFQRGGSQQGGYPYLACLVISPVSSSRLSRHLACLVVTVISANRGLPEVTNRVVGGIQSTTETRRARRKKVPPTTSFSLCSLRLDYSLFSVRFRAFRDSVVTLFFAITFLVSTATSRGAPSKDNSAVAPVFSGGLLPRNVCRLLPGKG